MNSWGRWEITLENKHIFYAVSVFYFIIPYMFFNHYHWAPPHRLPLTPIDVQVPFLPWTGWVYSLTYLLPFYPAVVTTDLAGVRALLKSFFWVSTWAFLTFALYPTVYPRALMSPLGTSLFPLSLIRYLDAPTNCLPSLHVAYSFTGAFFVMRYSWKAGILALFIAAAISASTLTTKQHYVWDVVTGYILARVVWQYAKMKWLNEEI
jgi:membrane-associated phospholipid phosphatase